MDPNRFKPDVDHSVFVFSGPGNLFMIKRYILVYKIITI